MSEHQRRALWAAALGVSQDELYGSDEPVVDQAEPREKPLRRVG